MASSVRLTTASTRTGPSCASPAAILCSRPAKAPYETARDRVRAAGENNRNCRGRSLCNLRRDVAASRDHGDLPAYQVGRQRRQPIVVTIRPAVLNCHVLALNVAGFLQAAEDRLRDVCECVGRSIVQEAHDGHCRLLRVRDERPCGSRTTEKHDELAPPHVALAQALKTKPNSAKNIPHRITAVWGLGTGQEGEICTQLFCAPHVACGSIASFWARSYFDRFTPMNGRAGP